MSGKRPATVDAVADAFTRTLAERPLFCDVLAHVPVSLERAVAADSARQFKPRPWTRST